ncbi:MAG: hypothetical protein HYX75_15240 [Acidobacteria bacterium]|nr:hypothetical protein [Acidobacteriota bacterium]
MSRFDSARLAALMRDLLARLLRRPEDLLRFDDVRERLRLKHVVDRGTQEVPIDRIVGTIGREREFSRAFLPREESLRERWEEISELAEGQRGFPPVELYLVGEAYFVVDGHHRVSVARVNAAPSIEARVKEFLTPVPLPADATVQDVVLREGQADFLETTGLVADRVDDYRTTQGNGYERLLDHISVHRYFRGIELGRDVTWEEAVASWRDTVYGPVVETIRTSEIMADFPDDTETDLYLFTMDHLYYLKQRYGEQAGQAADAVEGIREERKPRRGTRKRRARDRGK